MLTCESIGFTPLENSRGISNGVYILKDNVLFLENNFEVVFNGFC